VICLETVVSLLAASGQFVSPRVTGTLAMDIGLGNVGRK